MSLDEGLCFGSTDKLATDAIAELESSTNLDDLPKGFHGGSAKATREGYVALNQHEWFHFLYDLGKYCQRYQVRVRMVVHCAALDLLRLDTRDEHHYIYYFLEERHGKELEALLSCAQALRNERGIELAPNFLNDKHQREMTVYDQRRNAKEAFDRGHILMESTCSMGFGLLVYAPAWKYAFVSRAAHQWAHPAPKVLHATVECLMECLFQNDCLKVYIDEIDQWAKRYHKHVPEEILTIINNDFCDRYGWKPIKRRRSPSELTSPLSRLVQLLGHIDCRVNHAIE
jgi:hypothetical protein